MKSLVFSAAMITGEEPQTTNALALLSTLVKNNLDIDENNPLRIVFGMIKPGEIQTVRSIVALRLRDIFDDWGKTHGKTYRFYVDDSNPNEVCYIFYINNEDQKDVQASQPTFAPSVVDDVFFKDEQGQLIPFFATPIEKFKTFSKAMLTKMVEYFYHPTGRVFDSVDHFVDVLNKHFTVEVIGEESFKTFRDFLPNKTPDYVSRARWSYWVGLNRKVLVNFDNTFYGVRDVSFNHVYAIITNKGDVNIVDVLEKLSHISALIEEGQDNE